MNIALFAREPLILRDGRPFGEPGTVRGGSLSWPMPSTIAGMLRTRIALSRDPAYFEDPTAADRIRKIHIESILPVCRSEGQDWEFVYPKPADITLCTGPNDTLTFHGVSYVPQGTNGNNGITVPWKNWLIPLPTNREKPAGNPPLFWNESIYRTWLFNPEKLPSSIRPENLGWVLPSPDDRIHCCIDPQTGTAADGKLWMSSGSSLQSYDIQVGWKQYGLGIQIRGCEETDSIAGPCHLGGDRRVAWMEDVALNYPECPDSITGARFLRLFLVTPGNFGSWAPEWLLPPSESAAIETPWVNVPGTVHQVRMRSAIVPRWISVSGWDYQKQRPKATRKLVPPGSVYILEVQDPSSAADISRKLWLRPLLESETDGYGICLVGRGNINLS